MSRPTVDVVWDAVVNQLEVDADYGHEGAVRIADEAKQLMLAGSAENRAYERHKRWVDARAWLTGILVAAALCAGVAAAVYVPVRERANDYAHTDPGSVEAGAYWYIQQWYGLNDLPFGLVEQAQAHSAVDGHTAWLTRWRSRDGRQVCAYVWGRSSTTGAPHGTYGKVAACP